MIVSKNKMKFLVEQLEVREEIIHNLIIIADYFNNCSEITLESLEEIYREFKEQDHDTREFTELLGEHKRQRNIMEGKLEEIRTMVNKE